MGYRENIIELLNRILTKNYFDGRVYSHAAENCKRLIYKNFFRKLSHQKRSFCKRIKYEIQVQEREIVLSGEKYTPVSPEINLVKNSDLPVFRKEKDGLIKECYLREKESIGLYNTLLSRICIGQIREMLLFQKHSIQLILNEIDSLGLKFYEGIENEMNYK